MGGTLIIVVVLFALFWLFLVRPQRRQAFEHRELLESLEPGDEIVSTGGLFGVIRSVDGEELHVEIADGLVVRMSRRAVAGLVERDDEPGTPEEAPSAADQTADPS